MVTLPDPPAARIAESAALLLGKADCLDGRARTLWRSAQCRPARPYVAGDGEQALLVEDQLKVPDLRSHGRIPSLEADQEALQRLYYVVDVHGPIIAHWVAATPNAELRASSERHPVTRCALIRRKVHEEAREE